MTIRLVLPGLMIALVASSACAQDPSSEAGEATSTPSSAAAVDARETLAGSDDAAADPAEGAARPAAGAAEGLAYGRYVCRDYGSTSATFRNRFDLLEGGRYVFHGSRDIEGGYAYDPSTGRIDFTSGPYAAEPGDTTTIHGVFAPTDDGTPQITLVFEDPSFPNQGMTRETCRIRTD